jgi:2OG-Fe(II) oxygenase superfamily
MSRFEALTEVVANRRWIRRANPFPHVVAHNVFERSFYHELETAFQRVLLSGKFGRSGERKRIAPGMPAYDADVLLLTAGFSGPLGIFISKPWHDMIASLFGIRSTRDVQCALHHHRIGSATGWVHSDLGLRWFVGAPKPEGLNLACSGPTADAARRAGRIARPVVRAAAMLFYLNNEWSPGGGGETGLYRNGEDPPTRPAAMVPPVSNSILLFECTPYSFHSFLENRLHPRNSVNLWLYREKSEVVARWGERRIFDAARS